MKQGFYFRFYKKFHNEFICCLLANIAYFVYCLKFLLKKISRKKHSVEMSSKKALEIVNSVYPKSESKPEYINPSVDRELDLSVVIPVYNYVDIIEQNILSILNQKTDYKYEVILVDDGSTDGAQDILKKYESNPKVKLIFQKNSGIGAARNTGVNNATGKYLMFIDCDDTVHNDIVQTLLDEAYAKNSDIVMAAHNLAKEKNGVIYDVIPNVYPNRNLAGYKNNDKIMGYAGLPWAKVYKREMWNNVRFFPGYWYEDTIILMLLFTQCKNFSYLPKVVYEYKWYEKNFSHVQGNATNIKSIDSYWLMTEIIEQYKKLGLETDAKFYTLLLRHLSAFYYTSISGLESETVEALFVLAKDLFEKYKPENKVKLPYMLKQVEKSFVNNDIELWKLASCNQ